jgi:hypothetical protein
MSKNDEGLEDFNEIGVDKEAEDDTQSSETEELTQEEILTKTVIEEVSAFTKKHFNIERTFISQEKHFLETHNLTQLNNVNYFDIKTYLFTAINNITEIDMTIKSGFFGKLMDDVQVLYNLYADFMVKNKITGVVFETKFILGVKMYQELLSEYNKAKLDKTTYEGEFKKLEGLIKDLESKGDNVTDDERKALGLYRRKNADAVYHYAQAKEEVSRLFEEEKILKNKLQEIFIPEFELLRELMVTQIKEVINIKSFYLDKALWYYASDSNSIIKFFHDSDIKGDYSLKTFLSYGLKNVDLDKTLNRNYYDKLKAIIKILD